MPFIFFSSYNWVCSDPHVQREREREYAFTYCVYDRNPLNNENSLSQGSAGKHKSPYGPLFFSRNGFAVICLV